MFALPLAPGIFGSEPVTTTGVWTLGREEGAGCESALGRLSRHHQNQQVISIATMAKPPTKLPTMSPTRASELDPVAVFVELLVGAECLKGERLGWEDVG